MRRVMSETPREYSLSLEAATELEEQRKRAIEIVENLAVTLAATEIGRPREEREFVECKHVLQAVKRLEEFASSEEASASQSDVCVFISYSSKDTKFGSQLAAQLQDEQVTCFQADQTIPPAADWANKTWSALRQCRVVVFLITSQSIESDWCKYEIGAALALNYRRTPNSLPFSLTYAPFRV
jgi:TIR domain